MVTQHLADPHCWHLSRCLDQTVDCRTAFLDCTAQTQISEDLRGELETITLLHLFEELFSALGCLPIQSDLQSSCPPFSPGSSLSPVCLFRQPHSLCSSKEFLVEFIHLFFSVSWNYFCISYMSSVFRPFPLVSPFQLLFLHQFSSFNIQLIIYIILYIHIYKSHVCTSITCRVRLVLLVCMWLGLTIWNW